MRSSTAQAGARSASRLRQWTLTATPVTGPVGSTIITILVDDGLTVQAESFTLHVVALNVAPSFTAGPNQNANEDAGLQTVAGWATNISVGPGSESGQTPTFVVTNDNNALFSVQPTIAADGTLTYAVAAGAVGSATVTVSASPLMRWWQGAK